jgi:hypothetical protein
VFFPCHLHYFILILNIHSLLLLFDHHVPWRAERTVSDTLGKFQPPSGLVPALLSCLWSLLGASRTQSNPCDVNSTDSTDSVIIRLWRCTKPACSQTSDGFDERIHENTNAKMSQFKQSIKNVNIGHARALSPNIGKPYFNWKEEAESKPCAVWFWMLKTVETFNWHWFSHFSATVWCECCDSDWWYWMTTLPLWTWSLDRHLLRQ